MVEPEPLPAFLQFRAVPVRARRDGWTAELQRRFILLVARGSGAHEAARQLGRSRQTAYALRRKPGAEEFAAAWDAASDFARRASVAGRWVPAMEHGLDTILVPRFYRGRLVGFVQREDLQGAMRTLGRLDRLAASMSAGDEAFDFDELVARAAGEPLPEADKADAIPV